MISDTPALLYIHGLNSSAQSVKARQLIALMTSLGLADRLQVPELHHHPRQAMLQLESAIAELGRPLLVGSSSAATMRLIWHSATDSKRY